MGRWIGDLSCQTHNSNLFRSASGSGWVWGRQACLGYSIFLLTIPSWCFYCGSFCYLCPVFVCQTVMSVPCNFVVTCWEKSFSWFSCMWCFLVFFCHFPIWWPGSGVVFNCIESWSLLPYFDLCFLGRHRSCVFWKRQTWFNMVYVQPLAHA